MGDAAGLYASAAPWALAAWEEAAAAAVRPVRTTVASCRLSPGAPREDSHHPQGPQSSPAAPSTLSRPWRVHQR